MTELAAFTGAADIGVAAIRLENLVQRRRQFRDVPVVDAAGVELPGQLDQQGSPVAVSRPKGGLGGGAGNGISTRRSTTSTAQHPEAAARDCSQAR